MTEQPVSEFACKPAGNTLRDSSRKYPDLVATEVQKWDTGGKQVAQTYRLATRFLKGDPNG